MAPLLVSVSLVNILKTSSILYVCDVPACPCCLRERILQIFLWLASFRRSPPTLLAGLLQCWRHVGIFTTALTMASARTDGWRAAVGFRG